MRNRIEVANLVLWLDSVINSPIEHIIIGGDLALGLQGTKKSND